ncbi:MAG: nitroreductase family protein [Bacteroidales bacterium]|nr:nitroreductase family protein [Bacteroidales bacterium]
MEIANLIKTRWSPRAFTDHTLSNEEVLSLFEAARWAPSSMNEQPWKYYYAPREDVENFNKFIDCLLPGNQVWAKNASMLIISTAKKHFDYKGRPNRHAMHDTGAANTMICLQANHLGYQAHQMGGFDQDRTYETFGIDSEIYDLVSFIAVGKKGDPSILPDKLRESEIKPRERKRLDDIVNRIN